MNRTNPQGWEATEADLRGVVVPEETDSYHPVPYARFLEEVKLHVPRFGLVIETERFCLARDGMQMFGVLTCRAGDPASAFCIAIGLRNSYDKTLSVGLCAGVSVFVCENLMFTGEIEMHRKHTPRIFRDLPDLIYQMLNQLSAMNQRQASEFARMREIEVLDPFAHHLMIEAVKRDAMPASKLPHVIEAWENPPHEDFRPRNAWSLLNAFTEVTKSRSPRNQMESTLALSQLFRDAVLIN